ncbi:NADPH:quinone oxidoreductase family protein, partial [Candidatus Falkowbacteria bacterium]|nr:NADPH:quinone oxidoreductase family protein [Candidatus Falkowbacteria bacterium]
LQIAHGTSHVALGYRAGLKPGETLVVLGAAGGVGLAAVEIGHLMGARVVAVARGADKLAVTQAAGADHLIDADTPDLPAALKGLGGADVVYDAVGGTLGEAGLAALRPGGRFLVVGFASGAQPQVKLNHLLVKNLTVHGLYWGGYLKLAPAVLADSLAQVFAWAAAGAIRPHVSHSLPLDRSAEALELLRGRKATGKVVVTMT